MSEKFLKKIPKEPEKISLKTRGRESEKIQKDQEMMTATFQLNSKWPQRRNNSDHKHPNGFYLDKLSPVKLFKIKRYK